MSTRGTPLTNPRWVLILFLVSIIPIVALGYSANRSLRQAMESRDHSAAASAAYAGELAQTLVRQQLREYFRWREESLIWAHLEGEERFRATLRDIYLRSSLLEHTVFVAESDLQQTILAGGEAPSHMSAHEAAGQYKAKAWKYAVRQSIVSNLESEARERLGYRPEKGTFVHSTLVGEDESEEAFEPRFRWIEVDTNSPFGVCEDCAESIAKLAYDQREGVYTLLMVSFPLKGGKDTQTGLFAALAPPDGLIQEILRPAASRWAAIWEAPVPKGDIIEGVEHDSWPSAANGEKERIHGIRLVAREDRVIMAEADLPEAPRSVLFSMPLLGATSPWALQIFSRDGQSVDAAARESRRWNLLFAATVLLLVLGAVVLTRGFAHQIEASKLSNHLLSNVSHELKTPLSLIRLYTETLEAGRVKDEREGKKFLGIIGRESKRLGHLIENILNIQRIEEDRKQYSYAQVRPDKVVRETVDNYRFQLTEDGFEMKLDVDDNLPLLMIDEEAVAQALINLLDNAAKYSDTVKSIVVRCQQRDGEVLVSVRDRGIGIPQREHAKVFDSFYRVEKSLVHNVKGSGLGLAVVAHVAKAHGGRVEVDSTPGKGSKFTMHFPVGFDPDDS